MVVGTRTTLVPPHPVRPYRADACIGPEGPLAPVRLRQIPAAPGPMGRTGPTELRTGSRRAEPGGGTRRKTLRHDGNGEDATFAGHFGRASIGLALSRASYWLAVPAALAVPVDLMENVIQLMALRGNNSLLFLKEYLTPLKFAVASTGGLIALIGLARGLFTGRQGPES